MPRTSRLLRVSQVPVTDLSLADRDRMWHLYVGHYDNVTRPAFDRDLEEKTCVFLGRDASTGEVGGFSTARFYLHRADTRLVGIYFSGDTIILPRYWGEGGLHQAVMVAMARWKLSHPRIPLYWHLICSGYRTYLTLARNFPVHWPHHERPTPPAMRALLHSVCRARYGDSWRSDRGVVAVNGPQPVLKASVAPFTPTVLALPEVAFFVAANPGYADGDELAMLAPITPRSILHLALRQVWRRRPAQPSSRGAQRAATVPS